MTFLEALYGSQYTEIHQRGKDGNKGRLGGNMFLTAFVILFLIALLLVCVRFVPGLNESLAKSARKTFGYRSGKSIGMLLAIPLFAVIYFIIIKTVGSTENFKKHVDSFMQYPDEIKKKANTKILAPFFVLLIIVTGLGISSLF